jgi:hypothetical protein
MGAGLGSDGTLGGLAGTYLDPALGVPTSAQLAQPECAAPSLYRRDQLVCPVPAPSLPRTCSPALVHVAPRA